MTNFEKVKSKVNAVDVDGHTALIWAADKGNVEVANHLLSHPNIDPNLQVLGCSEDMSSPNFRFDMKLIVRTLRG